MYDYFYGTQAEQFSFFRIPKVLFTDEKYKDVSAEAKLLYGLLLERMGLSVKNGWFDSRGRVYILFAIDEVMEMVGCGKVKAIRLMEELEEKCGLIERKRQGLCRPNLIYVRNFCSQLDIPGNGSEKQPDVGLHGPDGSKSDRRYKDAPGRDHFGRENQSYKAAIVDKPVEKEVDKPGLADENQIPYFLKSENQTSRTIKTELPAVWNPDRNNTDISNPEKNKTTHPIYQEPCEDGMDEMERRRRCERYFRDRLEYDAILEDNPGDKGVLEGMLDLLVDTCCGNSKSFRIDGDEKLAEVVRSRLKKLNPFHIRYVLECFHENTSKVRNMKHYMLSAMYNASFTMDSYYRAKVNHDLYGTG